MIDVININVNGRNKKEIREELIKELDKKLDDTFKEKEEKKESDAFLKITARQEDRGNEEGFGVTVEADGDFAKLMTMLSASTMSALGSIIDDEVDMDTLAGFVMTLLFQFKEENDDIELTDMDLFGFVTRLLHEYNKFLKMENEEEE